MTSRAEVTTGTRRRTGKLRRAGSGRQVATRLRKPRSPKFSYDARKVLQKVWAASGGQCGKYLAASMVIQLDALERHGELTLDGRDSLNPAKTAREIADLQTRLADTGQRQDRAALPRQHPHRIARRPHRHPSQGLLTRTLRGHS